MNNIYVYYEIREGEYDDSFGIQGFIADGFSTNVQEALDWIGRHPEYVCRVFAGRELELMPIEVVKKWGIK